MSNINNNQLIKELNHHYRTIDMFATIYERLYRRYFIRVRLLDTLLLLNAILLCLTTFVDPKVLQFLQINSEKSQLILGTCAIFTFAIALIYFIIDWKAKAFSFSQAEETLSKLKLDCHEVLKSETWEEQSRGLQNKCIEYSFIINNLPKIPEKDFNKLKAYHKRRVELSKMSEVFPGSSVWLLKLLISWRANLHLLLRKPFLHTETGENKNAFNQSS